MVAAPDVMVCFLAAVAYNILLIATSTVVVVMVVVFIYWWYSSWIVVSKCTCGYCSAPAQQQMPTNCCQNVIVLNSASSL